MNRKKNSCGVRERMAATGVAKALIEARPDKSARFRARRVDVSRVGFEG
jgi:hypothetical protein